jgi:heme/copper-type cytochrome/quinol oxidase subunit 2
MILHQLVQTNASDLIFASKLRLIIIIIVTVVIIIGVTIFGFYKIRRYKSKKSNHPIILSNDELEKSLS